MISTSILLIGVVFASYCLTYLLRRYAIIKHLLDIPNSRSSHLIPTPRGGGLAFVVVFLFCLPILYLSSLLSSLFLLVLMGAGLLIAIVGFIDDKYNLSVHSRLLTHFIAAIWVLFWLNGFPSISLVSFIIPTPITTCCAIFYLVWLLNLYNFMDGIDGLASIEAICMCLGGIILYILLKYDLYTAPLFLLAASVLGFLIWNFPYARIFMGDVGSSFLGIILGALSIQAAWLSIPLFVAWLIMLGVFIVDTTWTLIHRILRKQKIYEAHRCHAYQFASRILGKHWPVSIGVLMINFIWLLPIAILVVLHFINAWLGLLIAYIPLVGLAYYLKAGSSE